MRQTELLLILIKIFLTYHNKDAKYIIKEKTHNIIINALKNLS